MEETVAQKLKRLCDARAAEIRQAQKDGVVLKPRFQEEEIDTGPTIEEILKDPVSVFNGEAPTEEEIKRSLKHVSR